MPAANLDWNPISGTTPSSTTGPDFDHTTGSGKYSYLESSCSGTGFPSRTGELVSGYYNFTALAAPQISLWYHMFGQTMGTLHLDVDTTQGVGPWVLDVIPAWTDNLFQWQEKTANLTAFGSKDSVRIRIRGITGTDFYSDMAIDDITVFNLNPFDLEVLAVNAGGGCGNSATTPFVISILNYGISPVPAGDTLFLTGQAGGAPFMDTLVLSAPLVSGDTLFYTFVNGSADLSGPVAVALSGSVAWSSDQELSNNSATGSAVGVPVVTTYPYFENFEGGRNGWIENQGSNGTWAFGNPTKAVITGASSGQNCFVTGGLTGTYLDNDFSWVESPCFDFSNACSPGMSMRVFWNAEFSWDGMNITATTDGGATWILVGLFGDPYNWYTDNTVVGNPGGFADGWSGRNSTSNGSGQWVTARHTLASLAGQPSVRFRINFGSDGSVVDEGVAFDDIRIYDVVDLGDDLSICAPNTTTLEAGDGAPSAFSWSTGATTSAITVSTSGTYTVTVTASPTCSKVDSMQVVVIDATSDVQLGPDGSYCDGLVLDAGYWPGSTYMWSSGATTRDLAVSAGGSYSVTVTTPCGALVDTIAVTLLAAPVMSLGGDTTVCDSATISGGAGFSSYNWSGGQTTSSILVSNSGLYWLEVTNAAGCVTRDSVQISVGQTPQVSLSALLLCNGQSGTLDAGAGAASYAWSTTATTQQITVTTSGTYSVTVSDALGCDASSSAVVTTSNTPVASFTATPGAAGLTWNFASTSTGPATSWSYTFGDGGSDTTANASHTYAASGSFTVTLIATNACGSDTTTQLLSVVGREEALAIGSLRVHPQPNDGRCWMEMPAEATGNLTLSVWDITGRNLRSIPLTAGQTRVELNLSDLAAGVYQLRLEGDAGVWQTRTWRQ